MKKAIIYTRPFCPYCSQAKATLEMLGIAYTEINTSKDPALLEEMYARTGGTTVPQVFLLVGGAEDLDHLLHEGDLQGILNHERL